MHINYLFAAATAAYHFSYVKSARKDNTSAVFQPTAAARLLSGERIY
jgi:hypothetical protein